MDERVLAEILARIERNREPPRAETGLRVDVAHLRRRLGMTQTQFARRFGLSVATIRHWECGNRRPRGPARILLKVIARDPRAVLKALSRSPVKSDEVTGLYP